MTDSRGMRETCSKLTKRHHDDVTDVDQYLLLLTSKTKFAHHSSLVFGSY